MDQKNSGAPGRDRSGLNGFAGLSRRIGERVELRASLGSGLRFPSLSELFFTGTTGAGGIVGNPELDPERSLTAEISARWLGRKLLVNAALFRNAIDDYIERLPVPGDDDLLTFENLTSGTIQGFELQGLFLPVENWRVSFGGQVLRGRSDDGQALADVPANEVYLGLAHHRGPWTFEARLTHRAEKTDPAQGTERPREASDVFNATVGRRLSSTWWLTVTGSNVFDETYFPSADRKAALAPGASIGVHLVRSVR
jgi:iron complex outermembrane receptor protein